MCEFCPTVGRCSICEHVVSVDYSTLRRAPVVSQLDPSSSDGFLIECRGVRVRYDRHTDALAVLNAIPSARLR